MMDVSMLFENETQRSFPHCQIVVTDMIVIPPVPVVC